MDPAAATSPPRHLLGLEQPLAGTIDIEGIGTPHCYERAAIWGALPVGALFSSMTLAENLAPRDHVTPVRGHLVTELVSELDPSALAHLPDTCLRNSPAA